MTEHTDQSMVTKTSDMSSRPYDWLQRLRKGTVNLESGDELLEIIDGFEASLEQILAEHKGMATELLGVYEQLGIVFEVTQRFSEVKKEADVIRLFVDSLRHSFIGRGVCYVDMGTDGTWRVVDGDIQLDGWLRFHLGRVHASSNVLVERREVAEDASGFKAVMIGPVVAGDDFVCAIVLANQEDAPEFRVSDMMLLESLTTFCGDFIRNQRLVSELHSMSLSVIRSLVNAVDQKDQYTSGHSIRVGFYATQLGKLVRLKRKDLQMLQWSALLHDVGKIGIHDDVLKKPGRLTDAEFAHIKEHPIRSHKIVRQVPQLADALDGVLHHHEHYDGGGYPLGLVGEEIPYQARIIQIADVFDALTSTRSYRPAHSWSKALSILESEAGKTVDPQLAAQFAGWIRSELSEGNESWERLIHRANRFTQEDACLEADSGD